MTAVTGLMMIAAGSSVSFGQGAADFGGFGAPAMMQRGGGSEGMAAIDVDADGDLDAVFSASGIAGASLEIFLNDGSGAFSAGASVPAEETWRLHAIDVDGDGDEDLVAGGPSARIFLNDGSGAPSFAGSIAAGAPVGGIAAADFDADGDADLAMTLGESRAVVVARNDGSGGFTAGEWMASEHRPRLAAAADMNADGAADLLTLNLADGATGVRSSLSVRLGDGAGGFGAPVRHDFGSTAMFLDTGDVDVDGDVDVVLGYLQQFGSGRVSVLLNNGSGVLSPPLVIGAAEQSAAARLVDLDGDADMDIVVTHEPGQVSVLLNNGVGGFTPAGLFGAAANAERLIVADLDGDDIPDALVGSRLHVEGAALTNLTAASPPSAFAMVSPADGALLAASEATAGWTGGRPSFTWERSIGFGVTHRFVAWNVRDEQTMLIDVSGLTEARFEAPEGVFEPGETYRWAALATNAQATRVSSSGVHTFTVLSERDLNADGHVSGADLARLLDSWGVIGSE
jgi:hypothetical protein